MRIVNIGSSWGQPGVVLGSSYWIQPDGVNLGSTWGQPGVNLGSTWGLPGVNLGSIWGQPGVNLYRSTTAQRPPAASHDVHTPYRPFSAPPPLVRPFSCTRLPLGPHKPVPVARVGQERGPGRKAGAS